MDFGPRLRDYLAPETKGRADDSTTVVVRSVILLL